MGDSPDRSEPWRQHLDTALSAIDSLSNTMRAVPAAELGPIAGQLRGANRTLWRLIDQLEAHRTSYIYDINSLLRKVAEGEQYDGSLVEVWLDLVQSNALRINDKELMKIAERRGIDVTEYMKEPEVDDGGGV